MTREEKLDLISRHLDDTLGEGDVRRFETLMSEDPEFAGMFHDLAMQHARLRRLARTLEVAPATVRADHLRRLGRQEEHGARRLLLAAAALAVALFGIYVMVRPRPALPPMAHRDAPPATREGPQEIPLEAPLAPTPRPVPNDLPPLPPVPAPEPASPPPSRDPAPSTPPPEETPPPAPPPAPRPVTEASVARVERLEGTVFILTPDPSPARIGQYLRAGQGLTVEGTTAAATILFPDGSQLDLRAGTTVPRLDDAGGRRVELRKGTLEARILQQAEGRPMVFITPQAEAAVLGTELTLSTDVDATRLEVHEGRVRLTRTVDGAFLDVTAEYAAVVAPGVPFTVHPLPRNTTTPPIPVPPAGTFTLINADTGRPVPGHENLRDGTVLNLARLPPHINIRFNPPFKCASVRFGLDAQPDYWIEEGPPYLLAGDRSGRIFAWTPTPGLHVITATPHEQPRASGRPGPTYRLTVQVVRKP